MTTKEQERRALAKIIAIIESLGEDSYIGTAFEGCVEIARENIDNDFACSMKQRAEMAENRAKRLAVELRRVTDEGLKLAGKNAALKEQLRDARETISAMSEREHRAIDALRGF